MTADFLFYVRWQSEKLLDLRVLNQVILIRLIKINEKKVFCYFFFALSIERTWPDLHFTSDYILYNWVCDE